MLSVWHGGSTCLRRPRHRAPFGILLDRFWIPWVQVYPFGVPWLPFGVPWALLGLPLDTFWVPLGASWALLGPLLGSLWTAGVSQVGSRTQHVGFWPPVCPQT